MFRRYVAGVTVLAAGVMGTVAPASAQDVASKDNKQHFRISLRFDAKSAAKGSAYTTAKNGEAKEAPNCAGGPDGEWRLTRFSACWTAGLTYTARDLRTHAPVGGGHLTITQSFELAGDRTEWVENDTLQLDKGSAWGVAKPGFLATWTAGCSSRCTSTKTQPFTPGTPLQDGQTLTGTTSFTNPQPDRGSIDEFAPGYTLELKSPGSVMDTPVSWSTPKLRCDNQFKTLLGGRRAGCVVSGFVPTFTVDKARNPVAALGVEWAQQNLPTKPGVEGAGQPLHRNPADARKHRRTVCQTGWRPRLIDVPTDSCDEYPFAATNEGGSQPGPQCAEMLPKVVWGDDGRLQPRRDENGQPITTVLQAPGPDTTCARVHVPLSQNTNVGGDLGRWAPDQRVVVGDPYWVKVG